MSKRKLSLSVAFVTLIAVLTVTLTSCMMVNMRKEKIVKRLIDDGYTVSYLTNTAWTSDYRSNNVIISEQMHFRKTTAEEGLLQVFVFVCGDTKSMDWVKERCEANSRTSVDAMKNYITYAYGNRKIVLYGDYIAVSLARNY